MRTNAKVIAAIVAAMVLGAWGYTLYQAHAARTAVRALVEDSGERLRLVLRAQPEDAVDYEEHARAVDAHAVTLRKLDPSRIVELADAADGYLVSAREILRRRAAMQSSRARLSDSTRALVAHVQADRGAADWTGQAVRLKEAANRDFREFRIATESYVSLLDSLPPAQAKIAPHVKASWPIDEQAVREARKMALDALERTDENMRETTRLEAYRGTRAAPAR